MVSTRLIGNRKDRGEKEVACYGPLDTVCRYGAFPVDLPEDNGQESDGADQHKEAVQDLEARHAEKAPCYARRNGQDHDHRRKSLELLPFCHGEKAHQEQKDKNHAVDNSECKPRYFQGSDQEDLDDQEDEERRQAPLLRPELRHVPVDGLHPGSSQGFFSFSSFSFSASFSLSSLRAVKVSAEVSLSASTTHPPPMDL